MEKDTLISNEKKKILQWKKSIEESTKIIAKESMANEMAQREVSKGKERIMGMKTAIEDLQTAKKKKIIAKRRIDIETASTGVTKWIQDVRTEFDILQITSVPAKIMKALKRDRDIYAEAIVNGTKATAKLTSMSDRLHIHPFKSETVQEGTHVVEYKDVLSHLPIQPPTLLFLDLAHNNVYKGRIYIRIEPELHAFVKNLPALATGMSGISILGNTCYGGGGSSNLAINIKLPVNDRPPTLVSSFRTSYGEVVCDFNLNSINTMFIKFEHSSSNFHQCVKIGHVESGLEVAKDCQELGNQEKTIISDCGLVLEM
ncbi:unnamed protein product [Meganyctiphanes norvegica]|uniref:Uncharacterized protein n=1 Tax=Meganyctiphanes norvegica TaxID=48144 RepID=A0AAV2S0K3_MEGNR